MFSRICDECCHLICENRCRCTESKVIGSMYIGMIEGCIYYDTETKKRCKNRVVETENGKLYMCNGHSSRKKSNKPIDLNKTKKSN